MIVVDASALLEVLLFTSTGVRVAGRLFGPRVSIHAPELLDLEVTQVLRRYERTGELDPARAAQALQDLEDFSIERYSHQPFLRRVWQLRDNLTAYDAAYVALAEALDASLMTCDARLARAPHRAHVEVLGA